MILHPSFLCADHSRREAALVKQNGAFRAGTRHLDFAWF